MSVPEWLNKWENAQSQTEAARVPKEEILTALEETPDSITVVDLRNDRERGYITKAVHIPATSINGPDDVKEKVIDKILAVKPETKTIAIHCNSSRQRAGYVGGWLDDYLKKNHQNLNVEILNEGIVGWFAGGDKFEGETTWVDNLDGVDQSSKHP